MSEDKAVPFSAEFLLKHALEAIEAGQHAYLLMNLEALKQNIRHYLDSNPATEQAFGWTGNPDADLALILLDRLDDTGEGNACRIEQLEGLVRTLAAKQATQPARAPLTEEPAAWRIFDGEGGFDYRDELPDLQSIAWSARYGRKWEPLYSSPRNPLTREQIVKIYEVPELAGTQFENATEKAIAVARAIERAHVIGEAGNA